MLVLFEDFDILVVDKSAGQIVHPAPGHERGALTEELVKRYPEMAGVGSAERPGVVHRLDQDTSGLIVVAKSQAAMDGLVKAFSSHRDVEKTYLAVCHGAPKTVSGRIENLIGRHPVDRKRMAIVERNGKRAVTEWRVVEGGAQGLSVFECKIETGRTHQIRVHLASLGCPIIGDATYGKSTLDRKLERVPARQMLHARKLVLRHPTTGETMEFVSPIPRDLEAYL